MGNKVTKNQEIHQSNTSAEKSISNDVVPQRQVLFIGVSGPTGSGKSTVSAALAKKLGSPLKPISADCFFRFPCSADFGSCKQRPLHTCWEHPDSVDHAMLLKRLRTIKHLLATASVIPKVVLKGTILRGKQKLNVNQNDIGKQFSTESIVIIVEGFLLYADKNLTGFLDYCLFLNINWETGCRRRFLRDCKISGKAEKSNLLYRCWRNIEYKKHMWPHFLEFKPLQLNNVAKTGKQCGHVNAELSPEEIEEAAIARLKQMGVPDTLFANAPTPDASYCAAESQNTFADAPKLPKQIPLPDSKNSASFPDRLRLPEGPQTRAALSLLGLAIGDCAGLPFELTNGVAASCTPAGMGPSREVYKQREGMTSRKNLVIELVTHGCVTGAGDPRRRAGTTWARPYSDDTVCADLKMSAVASAWCLTSTHADQVLELGGCRALLQRCVLQQYLKWAHNHKCEDGRGALFQGFGAFTKDFLIPSAGVNAVGKKFPGGKNMFTTSTVFGPWWPTDAFVAFVEDYFAGKFGFPSWGNGAVMSFAPHPISSASWWPAFTPKGGLSGHAEVLSGSHRSPLAKLGEVLLHEVLSAIYSGSLSETKCIPAVVGGLSGWKAVVREFQERPHECFPIVPFSEWLRTGEDCSAETASAFFTTLTMSTEKLPVATAKYGQLGALLQAASNWDDDHGHNWCQRKGKKLSRASPHDAEPVLFSQRGLNTVLIALWCASGVRTPWEMVDRVVYVGGDSDTVGAVAGQIACAMLPEAAVMEAFDTVVGLMNTSITAKNRTAVTMARAAAARYRHRVKLFVKGDVETLHATPSMIDPEYQDVTIHDNSF